MRPVLIIDDADMDFPGGTYGIVYCDPPWSYENSQHSGSADRLTGSADSHYPTMTIEEIKDLPVESIAADDCLLFMWTSSPHLDRAIEVGGAWGFKYITVGFCWVKDRINPSNYTMSQIELCLLFKRGRIPKPRGARNVRQLVEAPRGRHSAKPVEVRERIEAMFPEQEKIELFARERMEGWKCWGNEV